MAARDLQPLQHPTKTQALTSYLSELAHELGPGTRLPTARELCASLQVSMVTLNRALIELEGRNVLDCRRGVGIFVSPQLGFKSLGLLFDRDIFAAEVSPFSGLLVNALRAEALARDDELSVHFALRPRRGDLPLQDEVAAAVREKRLSGVFFSGDYNPEAVDWIEAQGVPLVALSHAPTSRYRVVIDYETLVSVGVETLQARGCRRIGLWLGPWFNSKRNNGANTVPEIEAFRAALENHGLVYQPELVWGLNPTPMKTPLSGEAQQERGSLAAHAWFGPDADPIYRDLDGLIVTNDILTRAALPVLRRLRVPLGRHRARALHIVSHANRGSNVLLGETTDVTPIEVNPTEVARAMFDLLEPLMQGRTPVEPTILVRPQLAE